MFNYIKGEIYKIFRGVSYYVIQLCSLVLGLLIWYIIYKSKAASFWTVFTVLTGSISDDFLQIVTIFSDVFPLLCVIFSMTVFGSDFRNGTLKNVIGCGISKTKVFFGKYIVSLVFALFIYFTSIFICSGLGAISGGMGEYDKIIFYTFLANCLFIAAYTFAFCGIEHLIQSSGGAMAMAVLIKIFVPLIVTITTLINGKTQKYLRIEWGQAISYVKKYGYAIEYSKYLFISATIMIVVGVLCYLGFRKKDVK